MNLALLIVGIIFLLIGIAGLWAYKIPPREESTLIGGIIFTGASILCFILIIIGA